MTTLLVPALILLATIPLVVGLMRANELFLLRFRGGKLRRVRGKIPPGLLAELEDVCRQGSTEATLRGVFEDHRPCLYVEGDVSPNQKQRLRNVIGMWPLAKIRAG